MQSPGSRSEMNGAGAQGETSNLFRILLSVPVPWVFVLTYLVGVVLQLFFPVIVRGPAALQLSIVAGIALFAVGAVFASWSLIIFHKTRTTTTPGETSKTLVTWGPYRLSRNPMYVSLILAYVGEAGMLSQIWPLVVLPFTLAYINGVVIPLEEFRLKEVFEDKYEHYRAAVRRWI